jgi:hypothetical protein
VIGYYLAQFDCTDDNVPPPPLEVLSSADFNKICDNCGSRHWQFFAGVEAWQTWITWLNTPDPAKEKMGKVVHLKPKPDQPKQATFRWLGDEAQTRRLREEQIHHYVQWTFFAAVAAAIVGVIGLGLTLLR